VKIPLAGELMANPSPERPGFWAYRVAPDGSLLETQLTPEEWHKIQEQAVADMNARIDVLNQHPLNASALEIMRRLGQIPTSGGILNRLHILSLATLALPCNEDSGDEPPWLAFAGRCRSVGSMENALLELEESGVTPADLTGQSPEQARKAAQLVLNGLEINH
jgi:hypothetical protein